MNLKKIIETNDFDSSVAGIVRGLKGFIFIIQPMDRWRKDSHGNFLIPYGGIGGKVDSNESMTQALKREFKEEIDCDIKIKDNSSEIVLISAKSISYTNLDIKTLFDLKQIPIYLCINKNTEKNRKSYTFIFTYEVTLDIETINPLDNPAVIEIPYDILEMVNKGGFSLRDLIDKGGILIKNKNLPMNLKLYSTPTSLALARYYNLCMI